MHPLHALRTVLLNVIFFGGLFLWTAIFMPISFLLGLWLVHVKNYPLAVSIRVLIHFYGTVCCRLLASLVPITVTYRAVDLPAACIIVANHQSFFDPYTIGFFPLRNIVFVVRSWPFRIPLYGHFMRRAGYLNAEHTEYQALASQAKKLLQEGATLVVFPEGTRSTTGALGRFRSGAFKLAIDSHMPIVPLCLDGTGKIFPKGSRFGTYAAAKATILPAVYPKDFEKYGETAHLHLQRHVKALIHKELCNSESAQ